MANTREQVAESLQEGDTLKDLDCFYENTVGKPLWYETGSPPAIIHCWGDELPTREYNAGYGGVEGEPVVCYSKNYVYFRATYDGSEWIAWIPRNPENVTYIPVVGG